MSTPVSPALVRAAMKSDDSELTPEEWRAWNSARYFAADETLRDHIRAVAAEMREIAAMHRQSSLPADEPSYYAALATAKSLERFANKLEGIE